jgi:hypothetical protein
MARHLGEVYETVLLDADIDKSAEVSDVRHDALDLDALLQVCNGRNAVEETRHPELPADIAAGLTAP